MSELHETNPLELATLLSSRICHDLISPIGAIVNGLELLDEYVDDSDRQSTLELVQQSAQQASSRLQLCRFAFGAIGSMDSEIGWSEIRKVLDEYMKWEKTDLNWNEHPDSLSKDKAKLLVNVVLLAKRCLPRGGEITVGVRTPQNGADSIMIDSAGEGACVPADIAKVIMEENREMQSVDTAQSLYCLNLARKCGMAIAVEMNDGTIRISGVQVG